MAGAVSLSGRISYIARDGVTRADSGARILILPEKRQGTALLSIEGFRNGAQAADLQLAQESLRLLGGAYAIADDGGRYQATLNSGGVYDVLIVSRHQSRDGRPALPAEVDRILGSYFDRPRLLIGQTQFHFSRLRYHGHEPELRDHVFVAG
ncbi:MAG: hypothetical protein KF774_02630 [Planctomyces sp.]|nr:hypothetical protein [Planctomyces sp.]